MPRALAGSTLASSWKAFPLQMQHRLCKCACVPEWHHAYSTQDVTAEAGDVEGGLGSRKVVGEVALRQGRVKERLEALEQNKVSPTPKGPIGIRFLQVFVILEAHPVDFDGRGPARCPAKGIRSLDPFCFA